MHVYLGQVTYYEEVYEVIRFGGTESVIRKEGKSSGTYLTRP